MKGRRMKSSRPSSDIAGQYLTETAAFSLMGVSLSSQRLHQLPFERGNTAVAQGLWVTGQEEIRPRAKALTVSDQNPPYPQEYRRSPSGLALPPCSWGSSRRSSSIGLWIDRSGERRAAAPLAKRSSHRRSAMQCPLVVHSERLARLNRHASFHAARGSGSEAAYGLSRRAAAVGLWPAI
jgi:hypothetical protein